MPNRTLYLATLLALGVAGLQGCAAVVVGGAATGAAVANDRRPVATFFEDKEALGRATTLRDEDKALKAASNIDISVYNLQVLLSGRTSRPDLAAALAERVAKLPKVRRVYNEVTEGEAGDLVQATRDAYLTTRINAELLNVELEGFDPTKVKVTTTHDVVYLMGLVKRAEADAATTTARNVRGVEKVVKLFEYID